MSKTILVTGPIASGKSELCRYLAAKGYAVYDCDSRTKQLYNSVPGLKQRVEEVTALPFEDLAKVFDYPDKLRALEALVYPLVAKDLNAWKRDQKSELLFIESAIALDKPQFAPFYNEVWLVRSSLQLRLSRRQNVQKRDPLQPKIDETKANIIIDNDSSIEEFHRKIDKILMNTEKTDLSKIIAISGTHGLYRFLALSRGNAVIAEALADSHRTVFDAHSKITTLADIAIYTSEGELKLKEVFLAVQKALEGANAPSPKDAQAVKALFAKAVPNYDADRFYASHMKKVLEWYNELVCFANLDFVEPENEETASE